MRRVTVAVSREIVPRRATLGARARAHRNGRLDVRRFRPNVMIAAGDAEGPVEAEWECVGWWSRLDGSRSTACWACSGEPHLTTTNSAIALRLVVPCVMRCEIAKWSPRNLRVRLRLR
jgi:hypothetical protein